MLNHRLNRIGQQFIILKLWNIDIFTNEYSNALNSSYFSTLPSIHVFCIYSVGHSKSLSYHFAITK